MQKVNPGQCGARWLSLASWGLAVLLLLTAVGVAGDAMLLLAELQQTEGHIERKQVHVVQREYDEAAMLLKEAQKLSFRRDVEAYLLQVRQAAVSVNQ